MFEPGVTPLSYIAGARALQAHHTGSILPALHWTFCPERLYAQLMLLLHENDIAIMVWDMMDFTPNRGMSSRGRCTALLVRHCLAGHRPVATLAEVL